MCCGCKWCVHVWVSGACICGEFEWFMHVVGVSGSCIRSGCK